MARLVFTAVFAALILGGAANAALAQEHDGERDVEDISAFHDALSPYGDWIYTEEYGYVWKPVGVAGDWRPYTYGRWVWTDEGWYWASSYEWGWAPFHYGRWAIYADYGWVWVPGTVWAPAWVEWRYSDVYVGWYPLWPSFVVAVGVWYEYPYWHHHDHWVFVEYDHFGARDQSRSYVPHERVGQAYAGTQESHEYHGHGADTHLAGPPPERVAKASGSAVVPTHLVSTDRPVHASALTRGGGQLQVFRPVFRQKAQVYLPSAAAAKVPEAARNSVGQFRPSRGETPGARPYGGGQLGQPRPKYGAPLGSGARPQGYGKPGYAPEGGASRGMKQYPHGQYVGPSSSPGLRHAPAEPEGESTYSPVKPKVKGKERKGP